MFPIRPLIESKAARLWLWLWLWCESAADISQQRNNSRPHTHVDARCGAARGRAEPPLAPSAGESVGWKRGNQSWLYRMECHRAATFQLKIRKIFVLDILKKAFFFSSAFILLV